MNTKTMEGLVGAKANVDLINSPFKVFKEARRKGDTATMERAMGYVDECSHRAEEYRSEAEEGTREDIKKAKEQAELEREEAIKKRREERESLEEKIEESREKDTVEVSEEGRMLLRENSDFDTTAFSGMKSENEESLLYSRTGEVFQAEGNANIMVTV